MPRIVEYNRPYFYDLLGLRKQDNRPYLSAPEKFAELRRLSTEAESVSTPRAAYSMAYRLTRIQWREFLNPRTSRARRNVAKRAIARLEKRFPGAGQTARSTYEAVHGDGDLYATGPNPDTYSRCNFSTHSLRLRLQGMKNRREWAAESKAKYGY